MSMTAYLFVTERHDLPDGGKGERLEGARDRDFTVEHVSGQHFGSETFLVELIAQLQFLDVVEKLDDFFVGPVAGRAQESRGEEFATAFASIEIDVKQIAGVRIALRSRNRDPE
jgi:hypothetical protein